MIGENFLYCDKCLSDFDMIMVNPESEQQFVPRDIIKTEQSSIRPKPNHFKTKYSDTLKLYFLIIKNPCNSFSQKEMILTDCEINELRSWLESPTLPKELIVHHHDTEEDTYYYGIFNDVQPYLIANECAGLYLTFTCNSPYGYSSPIKYTANFLNGATEKSITFVNNSADQNVALKPMIIVYPTESVFQSGSSISIINRNDNDKEMKINIPEGIEYIKLDCKNKTVTDHTGRLIRMSDIGWSPIDIITVSTENYNIYWLQLFNDVNKLIITKTGNVSKVEIKTQFVRKVDGL